MEQMEPKENVDTEEHDGLTLSMCVRDGQIDWHLVMDYLDIQARAFPLIGSFSRIVRIPPGVVLLGMLLVLLILVACGKSTSILCDIVGLLYPGYKTYKVIKHFEGSPSIRRAATAELTGAIGIDGSDPDEQLKFWAKYWIVYSLSYVLKYPIIAFFFWFPFLDLFKLFLTVALFHPRLRGAELVFNVFLFPFLLQYEKQIDSAIDYLEAKVGTFVGNAYGQSFEDRVKRQLASKLATAEAYVRAPTQMLKAGKLS